jgi:predicted nuclease with TOPRIM domain
MWDQQKRQRYHDLWQRNVKFGLSDTEQQELRQLIHEVEAEESAYLSPATARLRRSREQLETLNHALQRLVDRKETLVSRLRAVLAEAEAERQAITDEVEQLLAGNAPTGSSRG